MPETPDGTSGSGSARVAEDGSPRARKRRAVVASAVERERRRIARELHDGPLQSLGHVVWQLRAAAASVEHPHHVRPLLQDATSGLRQAIRDIRAVCQGLYPPRLRLGLAGALRTRLADLAKTTGATVSLAWRGPEPALDPEHQASLLRIAEEAVANACRHGRAGRIAVSVRIHETGLVLRIRDDGQGSLASSPAASSRGLGLASLRDRVQAAGGSWHVRMVRGAGVSLSVELPLPRAQTRSLEDGRP